MSSLLEESYQVPSQNNSSLKDIPPIETFQLRQNINGVETELLIQTFDDRILVIITQNGKVGYLTQASLPPQIPLPPPPKSNSQNENGNSSSLEILKVLPIPPSSLQLIPLIGTTTNSTLYDLYINQISTLIFYIIEMSSLSRRNVVVGLSLKKRQLSNNDNYNQDEEDESEILNDEERERFAGIMELVSQWTGPQ